MKRAKPNSLTLYRKPKPKSTIDDCTFLSMVKQERRLHIGNSIAMVVNIYAILTKIDNGIVLAMEVIWLKIK